MRTINNDTRTRTSQSNSLTKWRLLIMANLLIFTQSVASEVARVHEKELGAAHSISQGVLKKELNNERRKKIIEINKRSEASDQLHKKTPPKTRATILLSQKELVNKSAKNLIAQSNPDNYYADFAIYGAISFLEDDYDGDGFYQTFRVVFDADIYSYTEKQWSEVYALLYLSKNGGPWTHYFTTDTFIIEGESDLDEYEVITTFLSGYSSDYYDVLIDLYQVGYSDIVASFSSDDSNALYALSLESADYDEPYIEVVETSGGSIYWLILSLLSTLLIRIKTKII